MKCAWLLTGFVFCNCAMSVDGKTSIQRRVQHIRHAASMKLRELGFFGVDRLIVLDDPTKITHYILTGAFVDKPIELQQYVQEFVEFRTRMHAVQDDVQTKKTFENTAHLTYNSYNQKLKGDSAIDLGILALLGQYPLPEDN